MAGNAMMKAAVFLVRGSVAIREVPIPVCGPKDVLIKTGEAASAARMRASFGTDRKDHGGRRVRP